MSQRNSVSEPPHMSKHIPHSFNAYVQPPVWDWIAYRGTHAAELDALGNGQQNSDIRIGIQSSFTTDFVKQVIEAKLHFYGRRPCVTVGGFNQFRQELMNPASMHYAANPHATLLLLDPREWTFAGMLGEIEQIVRVHAKVVPESRLILSNIFHVESSNEEVSQRHTKINRHLQDMVSGNSHLRILDMDRWTRTWGWQRVNDPKHEFLAGMVVAPEMIPYLAEEILSFLYESLGLRKKCLVLDLDETLWGGIVGEDGASGIQLDVQPPGNVYRAVQAAAMGLREKGVLLAVASKNNHADAMEVIERHPMMMLRREHFASLQIGWQPKDEMLRAIARELNIGVDSLVFLDDNPNERERVRQLVPGVTVLDAPADPAWWPRYIAGLRCFEAAAMTEEDRRRSQMYDEERKRKEIQKASATLDEYIRDLGTVITMGVVKVSADPNLARVAQLSQRTNQFNLTTRRYTEGEITSTIRGGGRVFWMKVSDRLGDSGLVGVCIVSSVKECSVHIENLFMSCRVIGRNVEQVFLADILDRILSTGVKTVTAEYIPSDKNMQTSGFYDTMGFALIHDEKGCHSYKVDISTRTSTKAPYVQVKWEA